MIQGQIIKLQGGYYCVKTTDGQTLNCRARGRFRHDQVSPLVGDNVEISRSGADVDYIREILPRKNTLLRPAVANIDQLILVVSAHKPKPDFLLLDKLLLHAHKLNMRTVLCVNKIDDSPLEAIFKDFYPYSGVASQVILLSAWEQIGLDTLRDALLKRCSCFAGQSAVGKSSLLNALNPAMQLHVGGLSKKTDRGRHTTRHVELLELFEGARAMDTPGFSLLDQQDIKPMDIQYAMPEFLPYADQCKFQSCLHRSEPGCAVKQALQAGSISRGRYDRYLQILGEAEQYWKNRYE